MKVGDLVKVIDDDAKGTIIRIHKLRITIENELGFEETYGAHELILDQPLDITKVSFPKIEIQPTQPKNLNYQPTKEVDLHIGQLVDRYQNLSPSEIIQIQLQKIKDELTNARKQKTEKIIFIHGHGSGKLKEELIKILQKEPKLEFYDASFQKYKLGATEVRLF